MRDKDQLGPPCTRFLPSLPDPQDLPQNQASVVPISNLELVGKNYMTKKNNKKKKTNGNHKGNKKVYKIKDIQVRQQRERQPKPK